MNLVHEIKVGAFLIGSTALIIFLAMWLHRFDMASYLNISARFKDAGTLSPGATVLYRGVKAGIVDGIDLSEDEEYSLVKFRITKKNINIYKGSVAIILDKGFTGNKVLSIVPPENITKKIKLENGGIIEGQKSFTIEELEKLLSRLEQEGTLHGIINDSRQLLITSNKLSSRVDKLISSLDNTLSGQNGKKVNALIDNVSDMSVSLGQASKKINSVLDGKNTIGNIHSVIASSKSAMGKLDSFTDKAGNLVNKSDTLIEKSSSTVDKIDSTVGNIDKTVSNLNNTINNPELNGSIRQSMEKFSNVLTDIQNITGDKEVQSGLKDSLKKSSTNINTIGCFSKEMSNTFSKNFLIPRMIFGKPGKSLENCIKNSQ